MEDNELEYLQGSMDLNQLPQPIVSYCFNRIAKDVKKLKGEKNNEEKQSDNNFLYAFCNQVIGGKPFLECIRTDAPESKLILAYLNNPEQTQSIDNQTKQFLNQMVAAKIAMYLSNIRNIKISTHPEKFVNPDVSIVPVMAECTPSFDGYVRTGNINTRPDFYGNSAYMETMDFFFLEIDGKNVFSHLRKRQMWVKLSI